ncbi:MAG TPA: methyltransferase [Phenylobacterium sp.]|nr:methyltransferase [Phenylobacterium sp.]
MKTYLMAGAAGLTVAACMAAASYAAAPAASIHDALKDPRRPAADVARDPARKPGEVMRFAGVHSGERILDLMSGNAYFTRLFSAAAGARGRVYAVIPLEMARLCSPSEFAGSHAVEHDARYRNVAVSVQRMDRLKAPEPVDLVFTAQNYHDLHDHYFAGETVGEVNRRVFEALRPGGVYLIVDHVAEPGSGLRDTETRHRIDPAQIRREVEAAGFVFAGASPVLRNPADDHLLRVFDPQIRGKTDQVVLKFRKPA